MKKLVLCLFFCIALLMPLSAAAERHVELILDASGSMYQKLPDGRYRISAAKEALSDLIKGLPAQDLNVGLRVYGARLQPDAAGACTDSHLVVPMKGVDHSALLEEVRDTLARGKTPIAHSLEQALNDFPADAKECAVILVTDGEEACDGDVRAAAAKLKDHGCEIDLRIVGFGLSAEAAKSFEGLGRFENAGDGKALASALTRAVEDIAPPAPLAEATLEAAEEVAAGSSFEVSWKAEAGYSDYITIVPKGAKDGEFSFYGYVENGKNVTLSAPVEPGDYELRYQSDRVSGVTARRPIRVVAAEIAMEAPLSQPAGTTFQVKWIGPDGPEDYITLVTKDTPDDGYDRYQYTSVGPTLEFLAPLIAGDYELRYQSDREAGVFARRPIEITAVPIIMEAPSTVAPGSEITVEWQGPSGPGDYITLVPKTAADNTYEEYRYTRDGSSLVFTAPSTPGDYELRYQSDDMGGVFGRRAIRVQ